MEGATDAEATAIARQTAGSCGITITDPEPGAPGLAFADVTGTITAACIEAALSLRAPLHAVPGQVRRVPSPCGTGRC